MYCLHASEDFVCATSSVYMRKICAEEVLVIVNGERVSKTERTAYPKRKRADKYLYILYDIVKWSYETPRSSTVGPEIVLPLIPLSYINKLKLRKKT